MLLNTHQIVKPHSAGWEEQGGGRIIQYASSSYHDYIYIDENSLRFAFHVTPVCIILISMVYILFVSRIVLCLCKMWTGWVGEGVFLFSQAAQCAMDARDWCLSSDQMSLICCTLHSHVHMALSTEIPVSLHLITSIINMS